MAVLLAGCSTFGDVPPRRYYVLEDLGGAAVTARTPHPERVLLVAPTASNPFYDTQSLAFSRAPDQRAHYQLTAWTQRPGPRFTELLIRRLERTGAFQAVAAATTGVTGELILECRLEEFYFDASGQPGRVRIELSAQLVDPIRRAIVARQRFVHDVVTRDESVANVVETSSRVTTALLDQITAWVVDAAAAWARPRRPERLDGG
jgi:ABC-type uncharacterized transport system auxiliary subunit